MNDNRRLSSDRDESAVGCLLMLGSMLLTIGAVIYWGASALLVVGALVLIAAFVIA